MARFPRLSICLLVLGVTCLNHVTDGARVLLLPLPDTSQCRQVVSIGRELKTRGHKVILFVPDYFRVRRCTEPSPLDASADIEVQYFDTSDSIAEAVESKLDRLGDEVMSGGTGLLGRSRGARDVMREICYSYLEARDDLDELRLGGKVDVVIVDGSPAAHCLSLLPAYLGAQFVAVGSYIDPFDSAMPIPTSFYPAPLSGLSSNMGFWKRFSNFFHYAAQAWSGDLWGGFHQGKALGNRVSFLDQDKLIRKASFYLENSDYIVDYPKATFPNFLQVGGLTTTPSRPLPGPLRKFFDEAPDAGVVVVSFGPYVFTPNKKLEDKLLFAFSKLTSRVLMRINASRSFNKVKNIQTVSWFPQNDALGHPNTKLFVSHCGKNSFFEALHHGVPLLCCRFAGSDVLGTGLRVEEYGVGLSLDLLTISPESLLAAITSLLTDTSFARRIRAASKLFHSRPETPTQRAADAVEHVLKYGGGNLRPRVAEMSFFQYSGLDIGFVLFSIISGVAFLVYLVTTRYIVFLIPRRSHSTKQELEQEVEINSVSQDEAEAPVKKQKFLIKTNPQNTIAMLVILALIILFYIYV